MRFRVQAFFSIMPVFLGLAVGSGLLGLTLERREIVRGVQEEARAMAVTTAEFLDAPRMAILVRGETSTRDAHRVALAVDRILAPGRTQRLLLVAPDGDSVLASFGVAAGSPAIGISLDPASVVVGDMIESPDGRLKLPAGAPIRDADGDLAGYIVVEIDAGNAATAMAALLDKTMIIGIAISLVGLGVVVFISTVITNRIRRFRAAFASASIGNHAMRLADNQVIREMGQLANAFNTMQSVIDDLLLRRRRALREAEQFRGDAELAQAHAALFARPVAAGRDGTRLLARLIGRAPAGHFATIVATPTGLIGVVAALDGEGGELTRAQRASAARALVERLLEERPPAEALDELNRLFPLAAGRALLLAPGAEPAATWILDSGQGRFIGETLSLGRVLVLHTLGAGADRIIGLFVTETATLEIENLAGTLDSILGESLNGALLIAGQVNPAGQDPDGAGRDDDSLAS
jgi:HAMP domain-containing protein